MKKEHEKRKIAQGVSKNICEEELEGKEIDSNSENVEKNDKEDTVNDDKQNQNNSQNEPKLMSLQKKGVSVLKIKK